MQLERKTAIITGSSSGIGAAAARIFAAEGASVVLVARRADRLGTLVEEITSAGGQAFAVVGDVAEERVAENAVTQALDRTGRLDIGFNNAGTLGALGPITEMTAEDWRAVIETNLTAAFLGAKYQIAGMRDNGGSVIFTGSFVGHTIGLPGMTAYAASKAGLIGMTQCLAAEYGSKGIRVNALLPGGTLTEMAGDFSEAPEALDVVSNFHALRRLAQPEEIAHAALFLASDHASFVTGTAFLADGGNSIHKP